MLFHSLTYMFAFLPIVLIVYFFLNRKRLVCGAKIWLICASIFYYAWFNLAYAPLLIGTVLVNYFLYIIIKKYQKIEDDKTNKAKKVLITGIVLNVLLLAFFKYTNFLVNNINDIFKSDLYMFKILLPIGISFFTFQQIAFLVDTYKNKDLHYEFINYASFITFFPHLFAGPILHHSEMIPQFKSPRTKVLNYKNLVIGIFIFLIGFYKKAYLVGLLQGTVFVSFPILQELTTPEAWYYTCLEAFHAYLDFSSYMDMAIGTALMFNIKLPINFNSPYQSANLSEFWRRWHITLTRFLREYIYFPLGGNRKGEERANENIIMTFFIGGLWHGASWCTIAWGMLHGCGLIAYKYWKKLNIKMPNFVAMTITFVFVSIMGLLIRLQDFGLFSKLFISLFSFDFIMPVYKNHMIVFEVGKNSHDWLLQPLFIVVIAIILTFAKKSVEGIDLAKNFKPNFAYLLIVSIALLGTIFLYSQPKAFLYYQF